MVLSLFISSLGALHLEAGNSTLTSTDLTTTSDPTTGLSAYQLFQMGGVAMLLVPIGNDLYKRALDKISTLTLTDVVKFGSTIYGLTCGRTRPNPLKEYFSPEALVIPKPEKGEDGYNNKLIQYKRALKNYETFISLGGMLHRLIGIKNGTETNPLADDALGIFTYSFTRSTESATLFELGAYTSEVNTFLSTSTEGIEEAVSLKDWSKTIKRFLENGNFLKVDDPRVTGILNALSDMMTTGFMKVKIIRPADRPSTEELFMAFCFNPLDFNPDKGFMISPIFDTYIRLSVTSSSGVINTSQNIQAAEIAGQVPLSPMARDPAGDPVEHVVINMSPGSVPAPASTPGSLTSRYPASTPETVNLGKRRLTSAQLAKHMTPGLRDALSSCSATSSPPSLSLGRGPSSFPDTGLGNTSTRRLTSLPASDSQRRISLRSIGPTDTTSNPLGLSSIQEGEVDHQADLGTPPAPSSPVASPVARVVGGGTGLIPPIEEAGNRVS